MQRSPRQIGNPVTCRNAIADAPMGAEQAAAWRINEAFAPVAAERLRLARQHSRLTLNDHATQIIFPSA